MDHDPTVVTFTTDFVRIGALRGPLARVLLIRSRIPADQDPRTH